MQAERGARARALALVAGLVCAWAAVCSLAAERRPPRCDQGFSARLMAGTARAVCGAPPLGAREPPLSLGARRALGLPVDLNALTAKDLEDLSGVGPSLARRILAVRRSRGGFSSVEELASISGVGPARLKALRDALTPGGM